MAVNNFTSEEEPLSSGSDFDYELITGYIDNSLTEDQRQTVQKAIESDNNIRNRYELEKRTKSLLQSRLKRIETPQYLYTNIYAGIDQYSKKVTARNEFKQAPPVQPPYYQPVHKSNNQRKYLYMFSGLFAVLLIVFIAVNYFGKASFTGEHDMVEMSHSIFNKVAKGEMPIEHQTSDPKELESYLNGKVDFKVIVPNVRNAVLLGGDFEEMNGVKVAQIIHKKDSLIIYTFQTKMNNVMDDNSEKMVLASDVKESVKNGKNWFSCGKSKNRESGVVWYSNGVICCSIAYMNPEQIHAELTDYK